MKILITLLISILCFPQLFADASIDATQKKKSILLTAPGTLSGGSSKTEGEKSTELRRQQKYRYADDHYNQQMNKMQQFGQQYGQQNPWTQQPYDPNRGSNMTQGQNGPAYNNPWHLGGPQPEQGYQQIPPYPPQRNAYGYNPFGGMNNSMYPDYMDGIYRDTNPAAGSPLLNGLLPGGRGNGFPFNNFSGPFTPFGMF